MSDIPISQLGNSLRCQRDNSFASIIRQDLTQKDVLVFFECPKCNSKFQNTYPLVAYVRMANSGLIDPPQIKDFQKKMIIIHGHFPRIDKGLEGTYFVPPQTIPLIQKEGRKLLCRCNNFYTLTVKKFKKTFVELNMYCPVCTPKGRKEKIDVRALIVMGKAGLIDNEIVTQVREEYRQEVKGFDSAETYRGNDGTLATWAQEALGMVGESKRTKCYICGTPISEGVDRCPKCGSDID